MKTHVVLFLLLAALATTGSQCINDNFLVSVNLPLVNCVNVNPGTNLDPSGTVTLRLQDQIDPTFQNNLKNAHLYDIRIYVTGTYGGNISNGAVAINGTPLLTFSGAWSDFQAPQSLVSGSTHITKNTAGVNALLALLTQFVNGNTAAQATIVGSCHLSQSPVPSGLSVCIEIDVQVDALLTGS